MKSRKATKRLKKSKKLGATKPLSVRPTPNIMMSTSPDHLADEYEHAMSILKT